jgi:hypothetical protein
VRAFIDLALERLPQAAQAARAAPVATRLTARPAKAPRGHGERHVGDAVAARRLRHWAYAHIPLLAGVCIGAAGLVAAAGPTEPTDAAWITGVGIALAMLGLTAIGAAQAQSTRSPTEHAQHSAIALSPVLAALFVPAVGVLAAGIAAACLQLRLAASRRR